MILIYAHINNFKNYKSQEIIFDNSYEVTFRESKLSVRYRGVDAAQTVLRNIGGKLGSFGAVESDRGKTPENVHLLVGKTGSGKTNLLQLLGMKDSVRSHRMWEGEADSYFLLYKMDKNEFFLEICDVEIEQFPKAKPYNDPTMPERIRAKAARMAETRTVRFMVLEDELWSGAVCQKFKVIQEYGYGKNLPEKKARDMAVVLNCYDRNAFIRPPYSDDRETMDDFRGSWLGRMVFPYHRTSLWQICDYIREYLSDVEPGTSKRQASFVLSTHNFADQYPLQLPEHVAHEYWTFYGIKRDEELADFDEEARARLAKRKKKQDLTNKQMFIHDLWTDYAIYLRKWVEKIRSYTEDIPEENLDWSGTRDVYQEFADYYASKTYRDGFDPAELPDGEKISIVKRCVWLAEYIDRAGDRDPHGLLWQIMTDVKDIAKILEQLDEKYFTIDRFSIPIVDMVVGKNRELFEDLFERMEQYIPDDAGIFTEELLPYELTHLSTGEYQYAKVLGGLEQYLKISFSGRNGRGQKLDTIVLMDEPEAYMHPELARRFMAKLYEITEKYQAERTLQIIIGTHSPFMLSDVLPGQITRLDIDKESGNAIVMNGSDREYFGANIHSILADSFFLEYTIGEYSRTYLQSAYERLASYGKLEQLSDEASADVQNIRVLVPHIGDALIRRAFEIALDALGSQT